MTKGDLHIITEPFDFPKTVVKERSIEKSVLQQTGKDESWLIAALRTNHNVDLKDVLLATMDKSSQIKVFLYK